MSKVAVHISNTVAIRLARSMSQKIKVKFVTGNQNKLKEFQAITKDVFECESVKIDLPELQGEPDEISREKVRCAFKEAKCPVIIEDTSLCFNAYKGLPGPYIKWFLETLGNDGLPKMLAGFEDKTAYAMTIFAYLETESEEPQLFHGKTDGKIVAPRGDKMFGWDPNFEEASTGKTYAEMESDLKNSLSHRGKAARALIDHFKQKQVEAPDQGK